MSKSTETVATVNGRPITKGALDHWIGWQAVTRYEAIPQHRVPNGVIPDPPHYEACIAYLSSALRGNKPADLKSRLKRECQQQYDELREHVLNILITFDWLESEAAKQGITVTAEEARKRYKPFEAERFPTRGGFARYLKYSGARLNDELLRMRMDIISTKLQAKALTEGEAKGLKGQALLRSVGTYLNGFPSRWLARTTCRPGYVVANCREYRGPVPAEARL